MAGSARAVFKNHHLRRIPGGGVAAELALREPVSGLVLSSTFTSIADIGAEIFPWLPVRRFSTIRYDTLAKLPRIHVPVLVMHSRVDEVIPIPPRRKKFHRRQ